MAVSLQGYLQYIAIIFPTVTAIWCMATLIYINSKSPINPEIIDRYVAQTHPFIRRFIILISFFSLRYNFDDVLKSASYADLVVIFIPFIIYNYMNIKLTTNTIEYALSQNDNSLLLRTILFTLVTCMAAIVGVMYGYRLKHMDNEHGKN